MGLQNSGYVARYNSTTSRASPAFGIMPITTYTAVMRTTMTTAGTLADKIFSLYYNTIRGDQSLGIGSWDPACRKAFHIRGVRRDFASFIENVVVHHNFGDAIDSFGDVRNPTQHLALNLNDDDTHDSLEISGRADNFDGDVNDGPFLATGIAGYFSQPRRRALAVAHGSMMLVKDLGFGYFDGDGHGDVFESRNGLWCYLSGRERTWKTDLGEVYGGGPAKFSLRRLRRQWLH